MPFQTEAREKIACLKARWDVLFSKVEDFDDEVGGGSGMGKEVDTGRRLGTIVLLHCS
jgi:hypothetical protein